MGPPSTSAAFATLVPVAPTALLKNAPLAVMSFSARATTSAVTALAVVSAITPLVSAGASRATLAPSARARPSSPKQTLLPLHSSSTEQQCGAQTGTPLV